jgi:Na+-driven multidrug efflux pump
VLYGVGSAKYVMVVELCLHLVVLAPGAYLFGLAFDLGLAGVYVAPVLYASLLALAMVVRVRGGRWKDIRI